MMVNVAHQHGIDLHFFEASGKCGIDAVHHLTKFVLAGYSMKLTGVEAIHADVNRRQSGIAPAFNIPRQPVAVSGDRNLANRGVFRTAAMMSVKSRRREGSPPVRRTFRFPERRKPA